MGELTARGGWKSLTRGGVWPWVDVFPSIFYWFSAFFYVILCVSIDKHVLCMSYACLMHVLCIFHACSMPPLWAESNEFTRRNPRKTRSFQVLPIFFAKALTVQSPLETGHPTDFQRRGQRQNCETPEKRFVAFQVIPLSMFVLAHWKRSSFQSVVSTLHRCSRCQTWQPILHLVS